MGNVSGKWSPLYTHMGSKSVQLWGGGSNFHNLKIANVYIFCPNNSTLGNLFFRNVLRSMQGYTYNTDKLCLMVK